MRLILFLTVIAQIVLEPTLKRLSHDNKIMVKKKVHCQHIHHWAAVKANFATHQALNAT